MSQLLRDVLPDEQGIVNCLRYHSIVTCAHWMEHTQLDLLELGNMSLDQWGNFSRRVQDAMMPACVSVAHLLEAQKDVVLLQSGIPVLDHALGGGLPVGSILELVGPAGVGKSQFCMTLAARACLPEEHGGLAGAVVYIDTERKFSSQRLLQVMRHMVASSSAGSGTPPDAVEAQVQALGKRVHIIAPKTGRELTGVLEQLPEELQRRNTKLVLLDSVAALPRLEYESSQIADRQQQLASQASMLKGLAERFQISVVVTNQVTARDGGGDAGSGSRAALGIVWAHAVNIRIILEHHGGIRILRVAKSPLCPNVAAAYAISEGGVTSTDVHVPEALLCSVLDMGIHADHHVHATGAD